MRYGPVFTGAHFNFHSYIKQYFPDHQVTKAEFTLYTYLLFLTVVRLSIDY